MIGNIPPIHVGLCRVRHLIQNHLNTSGSLCGVPVHRPPVQGDGTTDRHYYRLIAERLQNFADLLEVIQRSFLGVA